MPRHTTTRRRFLQASAGTLAALPLLSSLRVGAQEKTFPKRLVLLYNPNGTIQDQFWPTNVTSETAWDFTEILSPLAHHREHLLLLKGLSIEVGAIGPGGPHQKGVGALFTGRELLEGEFVDGCGSRAGWANGMSVDQAIAELHGDSTLLRSLELGVRATASDVQSRICYSGPGKPLPPMNDPHQVHARLFAGANTDPTEVSALRERRHSVLDTVKEQYAAIEAQLGMEDRAKLGQHIELVRDVERRLDIIAANGEVECAVPAEPPRLEVDSEDAMPEVADMQVDLLSMALACDLTRVASLQFSNGLNRIRFPWLESTNEGHSLSHSQAPDSVDQFVRIAKWYAGRIARLMDNLAAIPEGDGTALDHTLLIWGNEVGVGTSHTHDNIPFMLAGGVPGAIRTGGRFIDQGGKSHADLLLSVLNAFDVDATTFGHPDYVTGTLSGMG